MKISPFNSKLESIVSYIAEEEGLTKEIVRDVVWSEFRLVIEAIRRGKEEGVRLPLMGIFGVKSKYEYRKKKDK